jgi:hypothetical protein
MAALILPDPASTIATLARPVRLRRGLAGTGDHRAPRAWPGWRWRSSPAACSGCRRGVDDRLDDVAPAGHRAARHAADRLAGAGHAVVRHRATARRCSPSSSPAFPWCLSARCRARARSTCTSRTWRGLPPAAAHGALRPLPAARVSYLFPAWITALGTSWKVAVMAELLVQRRRRRGAGGEPLASRHGRDAGLDGAVVGCCWRSNTCCWNRSSARWNAGARWPHEQAPALRCGTCLRADRGARAASTCAGAGRVLALVGPSGCGKTTLLHLCAGLLTCRRARWTTASPNPAVMFQQPRLLPWKTTARQHRARPQGGRPAARRMADARPGHGPCRRPRRRGAGPVPAPALGRHAKPRRAGARAGAGARPAADGRALLRARHRPQGATAPPAARPPGARKGWRC